VRRRRQLTGGRSGGQARGGIRERVPVGVSPRHTMRGRIGASSVASWLGAGLIPILGRSLDALCLEQPRLSDHCSDALQSQEPNPRQSDQSAPRKGHAPELCEVTCLR